ncbi:MAG: hypothetical protein PHN82_07725 [bacterium]|nr:hypothetical protein [bacterium]
MRRTLLALAVVALAVVIALSVRGRAIEAPLAGVIPAGASGYVGIIDAAGLADLVAGSNAWKALAGTGTADRIMREAGAAPDAAGAPARALLGERAAVAIYDAASPFGESILVASTPGRGRGALRPLLTAGFGARPAGSHGGMELFEFAPPVPAGLTAAFAEGGGAAFMALSRGAALDLARAAADLRAGGKGESLARDGDLRALTGRPTVRRGRLIGCFLFRQDAFESGFDWLPGIEHLRATAGAARAGGAWGGSAFREGGLILNVRTRTAARAGDGRPARLETLDLVPAGVVALGASRHSEEAVRALRRRSPSPGPIPDLEEVLGVSVEKDILPWIGGEAAFFLTGVETGGLLPLPAVAFILEAENPGEAGRTATRVFESFIPTPAAAGQPWSFLGPSLRRRERHGVEITTLALPLPGFSPSFAVAGRHLVVGTDEDGVGASLDAAGGRGRRATADPSFAALRRLLPSRLTSLAYADCHAALDAAGGVTAWALTARRLFGGPDDPDEAARAAQVEADLPAIVRALKVFRRLMAASIVRGGTVDQVLILRMEDIGEK